MTTSAFVITAIGRPIKARSGIPHVFKVIAVKPDGSVRTLIRKPLK